MQRARLLLAMVLGCAALPACSGEPKVRPNLAVIVMDTVRPDLLSVYGHERPTTPYLDEFAKQSTRFERAYSTSSWTLPSHGSLFTGVLPKVHRANQTYLQVASSLPLLQQRLQAVGYDTGGFSNNVWVSKRSGLDRGFDKFENYISTYGPQNKELAADQEGKLDPVANHQTILAVRRWLKQERDAQRPYYLFVNISEPHLPYLPPWRAAKHFVDTREERWEAIQRYFPEANSTGVLKRHYLGQDPLGPEDYASMQRLYEGDLRVVDAVVRGLVQAIDDFGTPENTIVVVLSDHGENIGEHEHLTHIFNVYDTNVRIPLLIRGPGFEPGQVDSRMVSILDLYPTLISAAGLSVDEHAVGYDLRAGIPDERVVVSTLEFPQVSLGIFKNEPVELHRKLDPYRNELRSAVGARYKVIRFFPSGREEIYDIVADPDETRLLSAGEVEDPEELQRLRQAIMQPMQPAPTGEEADWSDPEATQHIKDMGYGG